MTRTPLALADRAILAAAMTLAPAWLRSRRNLYRPDALPLRDHERAAFEPFFSSEVLATVRIARVEHFRRWPAEPLLAHLGLRGLLASQSIAGIALIDTVVIVLPALHDRKLSPLSLLFHELVHIEQYSALGPREFLYRYIRGWLAAGRSYLDIPLEEQAYRLTDLYDENPGRGFSVAERLRVELPMSPGDKPLPQ